MESPLRARKNPATIHSAMQRPGQTPSRAQPRKSSHGVFWVWKESARKLPKAQSIRDLPALPRHITGKVPLQLRDESRTQSGINTESALSLDPLECRSRRSRYIDG